MSTQSIQIGVEASYLADQSDTRTSAMFFRTRLRFAIPANYRYKLLTRRWLITDAGGKVREVRGDGVVGEQPRIRPGEYHRYSSLSIIETPVGTMEGSYGMVDDDGESFSASIPFSDWPYPVS